MRRQGMQITIGQLRRIADELEIEFKEQYISITGDYELSELSDSTINHHIIHQINIINMQGCSDTWEIEE